MKKRSIGLMLLSVLLCLSMLLISCSQESSGEETAPESTAPENISASTEYPIPQDIKADYASILAKWSEYLTFTGIKADGEALSEISYKFDVVDGYDVDVYANKFGNFYVVTTVRSDYNWNYDRYDPYHYSYQVYNIKTGAEILSRSVTHDVTSYRNPTCTIRPMNVDGIYLPIIEVKETRWVTTTDEFGNDRETEATYYSYYDENGGEIDYRLPEEERKQAYYNDADNTVRYEDGGKVYVYDNNGEYLVTYNKGEEKLIPEVHFEYGDFLYIFHGTGLYVLDKNYEKLCEYNVSSDYERYNNYILENGNVLFVYTNKVTAENASFDFEDTMGNKFNQKKVLVDVKTGKATEIAADFIIYDMITEFHAEDSGIEFKGANQLAVIGKIKDGVVSNYKTVAILDNELNIKEELPAFVKAQDGVIGMIDENKLVITASNYNGNKTICYTVDVKKATLALGVNVDLVSFVDGGFLVDGRLYNNDCEKIADFNEYDDYTVYDNFYILENEDKTVLAYILDGELVTKTIAYGDFTINVSGNESVIIVKDIYDYDEDETESSETGDYNDYYGDNANYKVYNAKGELLREFYREIRLVSEGDGYAWIKYMDGNGDDGTLYILK